MNWLRPSVIATTVYNFSIMGITGLIPFLEKASSRVHLKDFKGATVAIDTYCWLHKGVFSCAEKLARGEDTDLYIVYCLKYVQMLLQFDIKPILVFDGMHLPAKALTEKRRRESRRESKKRAAELLRLGKIEEARSHMRRCVDVTHEMALKLIKEMRQRNVDCIVAPYEADAQMAWLNKSGIAQYIITEDSDLTLFGAQNIIFKLDLSGNGLLVKAEKLHLAMGCGLERYSFDKFRRMCILSGCDYLDSLPGIGLAKACKFMLKTEQDDMRLALKKIPHYLNMKQLQVDDEYIENFLKAEATFKHMYIFNPLKRKMERLNDLDEFQTDEKYCCNAGSILDNDETALNLALGNLDPFTLKQLDTYHPDRDFGLSQPPPKHIKRAKHKSIWQGSSTYYSSNSPMKKEGVATASCALYFKKVDFISTTIEQDINASLCEENAKPAEADIFNMYRNESDEPEQKRRRMNTDESSPPASPKPTRHNPFAKQKEIGANESLTASVICANSSLLKVLSPRKFKQQTRLANGFKRNIFVQENVKVEVRSRFFAENVKLVTESAKTAYTAAATLVKQDLSDEIESIERLTQEHAKNQALLYNSPSPDKSARSQQRDTQITLSHRDSGVESMSSGQQSLTVNAVDAAEDISFGIETESIEISDEDEDYNQHKDCCEKVTAINVNPRVNSLTKTKPTPKKTANLDTFKQQKRQRIGLSKNQKTKTSTDTSANQTRLSMFGFQKRPTLK